MTVFREEKNSANPYVMVCKAVFNDQSISYRAKGILFYLLSRPDDWQIYESEIVKHATEGIKAVRSAVKELIKAGYISRYQRRSEKGKFKGYEYLVREMPVMPFRKTGNGTLLIQI